MIIILLQGPYNVVVKKYELCNGPKGKNLTDVNMDLSANGTIGVFNMSYYVNTRIDEVRFMNNMYSTNL